jgi:hypothetical protein
MSNSIGNLKNSGLQGNNFPWQLKMLQGQQCACDYLKEIDLNTDQVESLLTQILTAVQDGTDFEAALVVDANDLTWLEVRIWDPTPAPGAFLPPVYFEAGNNASGTPAFPITYINPNTYLAQIVSYTSNLISIEAGTPDALGQTTMAASMPVVIASNQTALPVTDNGGSITVDGTVSLSTATLTALENITVQNGAGAAAVNIQDGGNSITVDAIDLDIRPLVCTDEVSLCANGTTVNSGNPLPVDAGALTPSADGVGIYGSTDGGTNWTAVQVDTNGIVSTNTTIVGPTGPQNCVDSVAVTLCTQQAQVQITPNIQVLSGVIGFLPDAVYSISFANVGTVPITLSFDGGTTPVTIPVGVTINMDAGGLGNQYPPSTFAWDTDFVGASLIITYNT